MQFSVDGVSSQDNTGKRGMVVTIIPESALLSRAVAYLIETRRDFPERPLSALIDEAGMRFNLSPLDAEALMRFFSSEENNFFEDT